jgi:hypothetical protein
MQALRSFCPTGARLIGLMPAVAITRETLVPLDAKERETLMELLEKLR